MTRISRNRLDMEGGRIDQAALKNYAEATVTANSGSSYDVDLTQGNVFDITLTANCTFTFSNAASGVAQGFALILTQDSTGSRTATWPSSVKWPASTAPTLTTSANRVDVLTFLTVNGGTTWLGAIGAQNFDLSDPGLLFAWGGNLSGRLGIGDVANRSSPTQVGTLTDWANAAAGGTHSLGVKTAGTLWAWGRGWPAPRSDTRL